MRDGFGPCSIRVLSVAQSGFRVYCLFRGCRLPSFRHHLPVTGESTRPNGEFLTAS